MATAVKRFLFFMGLVAIWQGVVALKIWPEFLLPSPWGVVEAIVFGFTEGDYLLGILASLKRLFIGYGISIAIGVSLGASLARSKNLEDTLGSLVLGLQTLPSICWLPLALLWFGLNDTAITFVIVMGSTLSIATSVASGMKQVPPIYVQASRTLGAQGLPLYLKVILPASLPAIVEGLKQGWSFAWRSLMAGELLFVTAGLGHLLNMGRELNDMTQVLAVMAIIIAIGLITDRLIFSYVEKRIAERWGFRTV
jgi:NitT/TauT family transport system permease protein